MMLAGMVFRALEKMDGPCCWVLCREVNGKPKAFVTLHRLPIGVVRGFAVNLHVGSGWTVTIHETACRCEYGAAVGE